MLLLDSSVCGLFKWRQFEPEVILLAIGWYLRFSLSYRDVEELLADRGLHADHVTVWRWFQRYAPEMERRLRSRLKPTNDSWRVNFDVRPGERQVALPLPGGGLKRSDPGFSPLGQAGRGRSKALPGQALGQQNHPTPRVINTDGHAAYPPAITQLKREGTLDFGCRHRPVSYLNNSWSRATGPSSGGLTPARVSVLFGLPAARWPATR
jgi:IS6 family transposase